MRNLSWVMILGLAFFALGCDEEEPSSVGGGSSRPLTEEEQQVVIAERLLAELDLGSMIPGMTEEIVGGVLKENPGLTSDQAERFRQNVRSALEVDFKNLMVKAMVDYWTLEELEALRDDEMTPAVQKKMPGWEKHTEKVGYDWGVEIGEEAMKQALEGK